MQRPPLVYDITRLMTRIFSRTPNGIDRVDFAMANYFIDPDRSDRSGLMITALGPRVLKPFAAREAINNIRKHWGEDDEPEADEHFLDVVAAIDGAPTAPKRVSKKRRGQYIEALAWIRRHGVRVGDTPGDFLANGGVYLNGSQFPMQFDRLFRWSYRRPDIDNVFFFHDILPLETPEYFPPSGYARHQSRLDTLARSGRAAIVSTAVVRDALTRRLSKLGRRDMPIHVAPLPPDPIFSRRTSIESAVAGHPYFLICGTIEPRKNHLLLLHIWRDIVAQLGESAPKLVVIGARGWENEQVIDLLERCPGLRDHVIEASGLTTPSIKQLLLGARALLMPSFAEGYGLPIVEALALGVPVIASDIPVFREIGDGRLLTIDPTDGPGWRAAICSFAADDSPQRQDLLDRDDNYVAPKWTSFFASIEDFIFNLNAQAWRSTVTFDIRAVTAAESGARASAPVAQATTPTWLSVLKPPMPAP
jgi:glycosyltransferase involved in cell wall biosynthesis